MLRRILALLFLFMIVFSALQCGRRGTLTGGPKDITPPVLIKADPPNLTVNFSGKKIRLTFDEYVKLQNVQDQLIVSPPLKYQPEISPQGGASKYVEIKIKDTLKENTTYTFNFGQSIQDNNEGNPSSFLTYVFSTGDYIDSLQLQGAVKDAFNRKADDFISVMLYEIDSSYTDSTLFKKPPNYITNTLDSAVVFNLNYLKEGKYVLIALKDASKNNIYDQNSDKIGFVKDTISLPTDSVYLLSLFKEIPNYSMSVPSFAAKNKIIFGYYGGEEELKIEPMLPLPDTVQTLVRKEWEKDSLNFWFTPFETDSMVFTVTNALYKVIDTFTVKTRKLAVDSLVLKPNQSGNLNFNEDFKVVANIPILKVDSTKITIMKKDSSIINRPIQLDTLSNSLNVDLQPEPNETYNIALLPGALTDFFGATNDTLNYNLSTKNYADYGKLSMTLSGAVKYPVIVQLTNENGVTKIERYAQEDEIFVFEYIEPANYYVRVIQDVNQNGKWDTGNYLKKIQAEKVSYYPNAIEIRANWVKNETFILRE